MFPDAMVLCILCNQNFWHLKNQPPIYLYLIFLNLFFKKLIFTTCVACKNQIGNRQKIKLKNQFHEIEILKNQVQVDKRIVDILLKGTSNQF